MVGSEATKEQIDKVYESIEVARTTGGKIKKGVNEVTKSLERGTARIVAIASDASPAELIMHLPVLAKEKGVACVKVGTRAELGAAAGITVPAVAVAVVKEGNAKKTIDTLNAELSK